MGEAPLLSISLPITTGARTPAAEPNTAFSMANIAPRCDMGVTSAIMAGASVKIEMDSPAAMVNMTTFWIGPRARNCGAAIITPQISSAIQPVTARAERELAPAFRRRSEYHDTPKLIGTVMNTNMATSKPARAGAEPKPLFM